MISAIQEAAKRATQSALNLIPAAANPPKQYAKSTAAALTMMVAADFEFEPKEFQEACDYLSTLKPLVDNELTADALGYFKDYTTQCKLVMQDDNVDFVILQAEMLEEVRKVPSDYKMDLSRMMDQLIGVSQGDEIKVGRKIKAVL